MRDRRPKASRRRPSGAALLPPLGLRADHGRRTGGATGSRSGSMNDSLNGSPSPDVVDGVLTELGFRWTDARTRRRRLWTAALSSGAMIGLAAIATIAGSGLLLGGSASSGGLGSAIGRLGTDLPAAFSAAPSPDDLLRGLDDAITDIDDSAPMSGSAESATRDPIGGILATAPWRPV